MPLSYALSISHFVSSVGADAGFAALVGLAILVLLYFAHAREAATLRKALEAATQRLEELERRVAGTPGVPVAPRPPVSTPPGTVQAASPAQRGAPSAAQAGGPATVAARAATGPAVAPRPASVPPVAAPAGVAAPALTDATRVVPSPEQLATDRSARSADGAGKTPSPVTAAGGGNGSSAEGLAAPRSLLEHGLPGRRPTARWLVPLLVVVVAAAIAVVLVVVLSGASSHHGAGVHSSRPSIAAAPSGVAPGAVTVAVVNATSVNQLAHRVGGRLAGKGFREGALATASGRSLTTTAVAYLPGHRKDALAVAHALSLPARAVRQASSSTMGLVCPVGAVCGADVIVVAGSDLAPRR